MLCIKLSSDSVFSPFPRKRYPFHHTFYFVIFCNFQVSIFICFISFYLLIQKNQEAVLLCLTSEVSAKILFHHVGFLLHHLVFLRLSYQVKLPHCCLRFPFPLSLVSDFLCRRIRMLTIQNIMQRTRYSCFCSSPCGSLCQNRVTTPRCSAV